MSESVSELQLSEQLLEQTSEQPTHEFLDGAEGHNDERDEQVSDGQRHEEVVGDMLKFPVHTDRDADEDVTCSIPSVNIESDHST